MTVLDLMAELATHPPHSNVVVCDGTTLVLLATECIRFQPDDGSLWLDTTAGGTLLEDNGVRVSDDTAIVPPDVLAEAVAAWDAMPENQGPKGWPPGTEAWAASPRR